MDFNTPYQLKNKGYWWMDVIFYFSCALLIAVVFCYLVFIAKAYLQNQKINALEKKMLVYSTPQEKLYEKDIFDYKKKIDDFTKIIKSHKISSNVFSFIEKNTLPNVWFSSLNASEIKNEINLSGESENMGILSRQVQIFEENKDYVKNINILDSQTTEKGSVKFALSISLDPKIFDFTDSTLPAALENTITTQ